MLADAVPGAMIALVILFLILFVALLLYAEFRRWRELRDFSASIGFVFEPDPGDIHERYTSFSPFGNGHSESSSNLIHGRRDGIDWEFFEYSYKTGSGKNESTHSYGIAVARVPLAFAQIRIRPEGLFDKLASVVGFDDLDFESEEFSRQYFVKSTNRKQAYDLIHPKMMEFLLSIERLDWQFLGPVILLHQVGQYNTRDMLKVLNWVSGFLERVPAFVRQDIGIPTREANIS